MARYDDSHGRELSRPSEAASHCVGNCARISSALAGDLRYFCYFWAARKKRKLGRRHRRLSVPVANDPQILRDAQIPIGVSDLAQPPTTLYLHGSLPTQPMVAIVGTRRPTPEAAHFTETLARELVGHGFAVVSGGAAGIDTSAHRGALEASGQTLVVAPAGWLEPYPECNSELFREVVSKGGGYLSLVEPNTRAMLSQYFARNAVLVALAKATVVVQAPLRSGSRNSAHVARALGRLLFVVPSAPWVECGAGCIVELRLGARPLGCLADLLAGLSEVGVHGSRYPLQLELPLSKGVGRVRARTSTRHSSLLSKTPYLNEEAQADLAPVVAAITAGCNTLDSICLTSGWNTPKVQSALLRLTLSGRIRMTSAGRIEVVTY